MGCSVSRLDSHGPTFPARLRPLLLQRFSEIRARRHAGRALRDPTPSKKELLLKDIEEENNASQHLLPPNPCQMMEAYSIEDNFKIPEPLRNGEDVAGKLTDEVPNSQIDHIAKTIGNNNNNDHDVKENHVVKDGRLGWMGKNETKDGHVEKYHEMEARIEDAFTDADDDDEDDDDDDEDERMIGHEDDEAFPGSPSFRVYFKDTSVDRHIEIGKKDGLKNKVSSDNGVPSKESSVEKKVKKGKKRRSFRKVLPKNLLNVKSCYTPSHSSHDNTILLTGKTTTS